METIPRPPDGPAHTNQTPFSDADALLWDALPHLQLNIAQTAVLCGISVRQLGYWTKQGYVAATGRGARRMYGLNSLRRVLAIKDAMAGGVSLRQALRMLPEAGTPLVLPPTIPADEERTWPGGDDPKTLPSLSPQEAQTLTTELLALFTTNRYTRDSAAGLAVKVGRAPDAVSSVAEILCAHGVLSKTVTQGEAVYARAGECGV